MSDAAVVTNPKLRENNCPVCFTSELKSVGNILSGESKQYLYTYVVRTLLTESPTWRNKIVEQYGQEYLDKMIKRYSITIEEIKQRNAEIKQKQTEKQEKREQLEFEKMELRKQELEERRLKRQQEAEKPKPQPTEDPETRKARLALEAEWGTKPTPIGEGDKNAK